MCFLNFPVGFIPGGHLAANSRLHLHPGAGKDAAPGTEQPAQTLHPGNATSLSLCSTPVDKTAFLDDDACSCSPILYTSFSQYIMTVTAIFHQHWLPTLYCSALCMAS